MDTQKQKSEQSQPDPTAPVETGPQLRPATPAETEEATAHAKEFGETLEEKKDEYQEKVDKLLRIYESKGSLGTSKGKQLAIEQKNRIEVLARQKLEAYNQLMLDQRKARRDALLTEADTEFGAVYQPLERLVKYVRGVDHLDDKEFMRLTAFLEAMEKMKVNPESEKLFGRILSREKITETDYDYIFGLCHEIMPAKGQIQTKEMFETSQTGALLGALNDAQKMEFARRILKSKYSAEPEKVKGIIESLYVHQVLSTAQLQNLLSDMPAELRSYFEKMLSDPNFQKRRDQYDQFLRQKEMVLGGRGATNPLNALWGAPGLYLLASLWGTATAAVNFGINFDSKDIPGSLQKFLGGWGGVGLLTAIGGGSGVLAEMFPQFRNKLGQVFKPSSIEVSDTDREKGEFEQARTGLYQSFGNNSELPKLLGLKFSESQSVFEKIMAYFTENAKDDSKLKKLDMKPLIRELKKSDQPEVAALLQKNIGKSGHLETFAAFLKDLFAKFKIMKIESAAGFKTFYEEYRKSQGLT